MNGHPRHALVTGGAGFIGSHLVESLLGDGWRVTVVDNFDRFYDPAAKEANLKVANVHPYCRVVRTDIRDLDALLRQLTSAYDVVVHLAAKAGVGPSLRDPTTYNQVNVHGTQNVLELARLLAIPQYVFASSSSVYGVNPNVPWRECDHVLLPISPYASSKVSGELMGHVYAHLYGIRFIALRFFTVFGPRQRPDLAIHKFSRLMLDEQPLSIYGDGSSGRDYSFVGDIVAGIRAAMDYDATLYEVINLGNNRPVRLLELVDTLEQVLGVKARVRHCPEQPGDVPVTFADISKASALLGYHPQTDLRSGIEVFARWLMSSSQSAAHG